MGQYIPSTKEEQQEMLAAVGVDSVAAFYENVPDSVLLKESLHIPAGKSELEVRQTMEAMSRQNKVFGTILRGAGAYQHYIPSIVKYITAKEEFVTAYTPYQAEMSQGILQSIFEYQTMICDLTGMDTSNASVYDGASAAAEAIAMCRELKRTVALASDTPHPDVLATMRTYCSGAGYELRFVPEKNGRTDTEALEQALTADVCCFYVQQPNFYGNFEDGTALGETVHQAGAKYIMGYAAGLRRSLPGLYGRYLRDDPQIAGPHCRGNKRCRWQPCLCIDITSQRAAYSPRKSFQQCMFQSGALCLNCGGVYEHYGTGRYETGSRAVHVQSPLFCAEAGSD